ncbi:MAG: copper resistance protein NlpE [Prevotellaceae bacterium]|nr:copper resistance protein NlpE [Prevotellaceae bacterium]
MKKVCFSAIAIAILSAAGFASCGGGQKQHNQEEIVITEMADNSRISVNWKGTYTGVIPCADCEGINVTIVLSDSTYQLSYDYLGKGKSPVTEISGSFSWDDKGGTITLANDASIPPYYQVGEGRLIQLDMEGKHITGENAEMYELTQIEIVE